MKTPWKTRSTCSSALTRLEVMWESSTSGAAPFQLLTHIQWLSSVAGGFQWSHICQTSLNHHILGRVGQLVLCPFLICIEACVWRPAVILLCSAHARSSPSRCLVLCRDFASCLQAACCHVSHWRDSSPIHHHERTHPCAGQQWCAVWSSLYPPGPGDPRGLGGVAGQHRCAAPDAWRPAERGEPGLQRLAVVYGHRCQSHQHDCWQRYALTMKAAFADRISVPCQMQEETSPDW